jgi:ferritin-like metal-binding protein YciE
MCPASLHDLYVQQLRDLYSAETQIVKALPKLISAATHPELKTAFADHLAKTKVHVERLEKICEDLDVSAKGRYCAGVEGIIAEGGELIKEKPEPNVLDAGLAAAAQQVEHYEMAGYGTLRTWADKLGHAAHGSLLQQTLSDEKEADQLLSQIASTSLNADAASKGAATAPASRPASSPVDRPAAVDPVIP